MRSVAEEAHACHKTILYLSYYCSRPGFLQLVSSNVASPGTVLCVQDGMRQTKTPKL